MLIECNVHAIIAFLTNRAVFSIFNSQFNERNTP
jgi:hypothetical protein